MSAPVPTPTRQHSTVSSASSGATTIRAGTRRSSTSTSSNNNFFARRFHKSLDSDDGEQEDGSGNSSDGEENVAGPSDYYKRSPTPPTSWKRSSSRTSFADSDSGHYDEWTASPYHGSPDFDQSIVDDADSTSDIRSLVNGHAESGEDHNSAASNPDGVGDPALPTTPRRETHIHPSISRLRSHGLTPRLPRHHRAASNFSQISETSLASAQASSTSPGFTLHPLRRLQLAAPTCMDIRGAIAIGTMSGATHVYSFNQELRHTLRACSVPVTCVSISSDSTYIAVGHQNGDIYLYDLAHPSKPARSVTAISLKHVASGRGEGHLTTPITHISFVGSRHTSIVSGDEDGRVFWWSLGRVVGVDSNDVLRMLGNYHKQSRLYAASTLPPGPHATDTFGLSALLTPAKLVVVGLNPPKTWHRKMRDVPHADTGAAAWLPANSSLPPTSDPVLAYSWGSVLRLLVIQVHGYPRFTDAGRWDAPSPIRSVYWLDNNHILLLCHELILLDVRTMSAVETMSGPRPIATRCYREKVFILTESSLSIASVVHWNDRILSRVHQGDFLGAIHLALAYYEGRASGNTIGLEPTTLQSTVAGRLTELMKASLEWAFSEERMQDDTHYSADGRGVDLTALFESLATSCIEACLATTRTDFLFNVVYEFYSSAGIQGIFLQLLEPYIFAGQLQETPPEIVKSLISLHTDAGDFRQAEAVIWHVDPASLDINQAVTVCEAHDLWDALVHVYNRTLHDYVTPLERLLPTTTKVYTYLEHVLTGHAYPSGEPLPEQEAQTAREAVYTFVLAHLTSFPDTEALLHVLDIAFEDPFLDDAATSRQGIINQLLSSALDPTLLHLFVARNIPKYPQYILLSPAVLHRILTALAQNRDETSREDRQLATEYLLSAYTPHDDVYDLFEAAGFYRILGQHYRSERKWAELARVLTRDPVNLFPALEEIMPQASEVIELILPDLVRRSLNESAGLIDRYRPDLHHRVVASLAPIKQLNYLRCVMENSTPHLGLHLRHLYAKLLVEFETGSVLPFLDQRGPEFFDLAQLQSDFQAIPFDEGQMWALDQQGMTRMAFDVASDTLRTRGADLANDLHEIDNISSVTRLAARLCREHASDPDIEVMWFGVLHELVEMVQGVSAVSPRHTALDPLRALVRETLLEFVSASVSFPRLFRRLIDSSSKTTRTFPEFRSILIGMLESYRAEGQMLAMSTKMVEADLFLLIDSVTASRQRGWTLSTPSCQTCGRDLTDGGEFHIKATGTAVHAECK